MKNRIMPPDVRIIIEGADGTGKTTIARKLAELYDLSYVHLTNKDPRDVDFYYQFLRKRNIITDRHFISEWIYPTVFKREPELYPFELNELMKIVEKEKILVVILTADLDEIMSRLEAKDEYQEVKDNLEWTDRQFMEFAKTYEIPVFNTSHYSADGIVSQIDRIIQSNL